MCHHLGRSPQTTLGYAYTDMLRCIIRDVPSANEIIVNRLQRGGEHFARADELAVKFFLDTIMITRSFPVRMENSHAIVPQRGRECTVICKNRVVAMPLAPGQAIVRPMARRRLAAPTLAPGLAGPLPCQALAFAASVLVE